MKIMEIGRLIVRAELQQFTRPAFEFAAFSLAQLRQDFRLSRVTQSYNSIGSKDSTDSRPIVVAVELRWMMGATVARRRRKIYATERCLTSEFASR
jgi:hypothetical protein